MRDEMVRAMQLCGAASLKALTPDLVSVRSSLRPASRVGVASAPSASPLFVVKDADGVPRGVTVDLGHALAKELCVEAEFCRAQYR
jgi:ABC-type amino acid transport substrate-binding protein